MGKQDRIVAIFREQYATLDDGTLREIASGDVPWTEEGHYLYPARLAARELLLARGVADVPAVPRWDPDAPLPWSLRLAAVAGTVFLALGLSAAVALSAPEQPSDAAACAAATEALQASVLGRRYQLVTSHCFVASDDERTEGTHRVIPVRADGCVVLGGATSGTPAAISDRSERLRLSWFVREERPGRHCARAVVVGELVLGRGRPWFVRIPVELQP